MNNVHIIQQAKIRLEENFIKPKWIKLSSEAHLRLIEELNQRDGRRHSLILEILGLPVLIDPECPDGGAYIVGEENEMLR